MQDGVKNLFGIVEKYSKGSVPVWSDTEDSVEITTLALPKEVMFRPTVACFKDVLLLSSSEQIAHQSLTMLLGKRGQSKFGDPRLKKALLQLPGPEDRLTFYDIRQQFCQLRSVGQLVREKSGGDEDAEDTRQLTRFLSQMGVLAPTFLGMAGAQADHQEWMKPVQEVLGLLPSVAKIAVTQPGSEPNVYSRRSVTLVRPDSAKETVPRRE